MAKMKMELERIEDMLPENLEADGRMLDKAFYEYIEKQNFLRGLLNKGLDTSIDTNQKIYGKN